MSYIHKSLLDGEEIIYLTRRHKIIFTWPIIWLLVAAVLFGIKWFLVFRPEVNFALMIFSGIFLAVALVHALVRLHLGSDAYSDGSCVFTSRELHGFHWPIRNLDCERDVSVESA